MISYKSHLTHLECTKTGDRYDSEPLQNLSDQNAPLVARYDLEKLSSTFSRDTFRDRPPTMWRYAELLPVRNPENIVSLGEGFTPLRKVDQLAGWIGLKDLYIKDESINPTGSFKARGLSSAVSAAIERGACGFTIPSAGNAAGALSAYSASAGCDAHVFMPKDTPLAFKLECEYYGAEITLMDGLISDCAVEARRKQQESGWYEVSTLREPYRLEGKKTMGFEIAEQLNWEVPDVIIYPTGGGTGLIGIWKAFDELEQLGWIGSKRPRMIAVQSEGCAPIVRAFQSGKQEAESWENAETVASGLRVPGAIGDFIILKILRESGGDAVAVSDESLLHYSRKMSEYTGIFPAPEGGATLAALMELRDNDWIDDDEKIVLLNTGSGFKYLEALQGVDEELAARTMLSLLR
ncbi:MAG: threonine synthase [Balneolaceae bacterium]|nr:threonine synthase [Balneolaceae bacterium]